MAIGTNPGGGVLAGTTPVSAVAGEASFTNLSMTVGGGSGFTLVASAEGLLPATSASFAIENPLPTTASLSPYWARVGSTGITLTVTGGNFVPLSKVNWNGSERTTTFGNANTLTAVIEASDFFSAGTATVAVVTPAPNGGTSTPPLSFRIEPTPPSVVYVDTNYAGKANDTLVDFPYSGPGTHIIGYDAFATVQAGVSAVAAAGTVNVAAGMYAENVVISRAVKLLGPNSGKTGYALDRGAEAIVYPPANSPDNDGQAGAVFYLQAVNVTIAGFIIDGDNPTVFGGTTLNGADINASRAVLSNPNFNKDLRFTFDNNVIRNMKNAALYLNPNTTNDVSESRVPSSFNYIRGNYVSNMYLRAFYLQNAWEFRVENNRLENVHIGVVAEKCGFAAAEGFAPGFFNNTVVLRDSGSASRQMGLCVNNRFDSASPFSITGNTVSIIGSSTNPDYSRKLTCT